MHAASRGSADTAGEARRANERAACARMIDGFEKRWPRLLGRYDKKS